MRARFLALRSTGIQPTHLVAARATVDWDLNSPSTFGLIADYTFPPLFDCPTRLELILSSADANGDGILEVCGHARRCACGAVVGRLPLPWQQDAIRLDLDDGTCSTRRGPFQIVLCVCHNMIARVHLLVLLRLCPSSFRVSAARVARVHPLVLLILCSSYFVCLPHVQLHECISLFFGDEMRATLFELAGGDEDGEVKTG